MDQIPEFLKINSILGFLGKKRSGKSWMVKRGLTKMRRFVVLDPLGEYDGVVVCETYEEIYRHIAGFKSNNFRVAFRAKNEYELEKFWILSNEINDYTLIIEEADLVASTNKVHPQLRHRLAHGRHYRRNTIWITRSPFEIDRFLTRQTDVLVCFYQSEPRDLKYLENYTFNKNPQLLNYEKYEYSVWYSYPQASKLIEIFK